MSVKDLNHCECLCHTAFAGEQFVHVGACCSKCKYCGETRIKELSLHQLNCSDTPEEVKAELKKQKERS